jgi:hypothetical protein
MNNTQEEVENKIKTEFRSEDFETPEEKAQRIKDEDIEPTEKDILKNQILSDLDIMKKDVDAGFYNFLNCADYLKAMNNILSKISNLLGNNELDEARVLDEKVEELRQEN